jgi:hypothetical protein
VNLLKECYQWEAEHVGGRTVRQYNDDGSENPSTMIVPEKVVRASILPRMVGLPRHDVGLDPDRKQRFVRRFARSFEKRCETNVESILALYKYAIVDGRAKKVDYSIRNGAVVPEGGYRPEDVRGLDHLTTVGDALAVMGFDETTRLSEFLVNMRVANPHKAIGEQPPFYRDLSEKYGLSIPLGGLLSTLSMSDRTRLGDFLEILGFPKAGSRFEYVHCIETTHYRLWVLSSSGQALVTNPEYELYL